MARRRSHSCSTPSTQLLQAKRAPAAPRHPESKCGWACTTLGHVRCDVALPISDHVSLAQITAHGAVHVSHGYAVVESCARFPHVGQYDSVCAAVAAERDWTRKRERIHKHGSHG